MKIVRILSILFLVISVLCVLEYINLMSLYKDQSDWSAFGVEHNDELTQSEKEKALQEIALVDKQISNAKKMTITVFVLSVLLFVIFRWILHKKATSDISTRTLV